MVRVSPRNVRNAGRLCMFLNVMYVHVLYVRYGCLAMCEYILCVRVWYVINVGYVRVCACYVCMYACVVCLYLGMLCMCVYYMLFVCVYACYVWYV